jgi:hypothetical protein
MNLQHETRPDESEGARRVREQELGQVALEKCRIACETRDLDQIKESFEQLRLGKHNVMYLLHKTILMPWLEATRYMLEHGADPNQIALITLSQKCRSIAMFQLLADFGMDYKSEQWNILP